MILSFIIYMKQIPSLKAEQDIPSILWNPTIHNSVHNNLSLDPVISHMNAVHLFLQYLVFQHSF
jgi:hypothetical protein